MFRSPRLTLALAIALTVAAGALWLAAFRTLTGARIDATIMTGFVGLGGPRVDRLADAVAHLADPTPFALATVAIVTAALVRLRPWLAVMTGVVLIGANATTQALKVLTAEPRLASAMTGGYVDAASWPSGHATAAMTMALCAAVVVPSRWRPFVLALGGVLTIAVGYSVLVLEWHLPSDVLGAFCVASVWSLLGITAATTLERRRARARPLELQAALGPAAAAGVAVAAGLAAAALARPDAALAYAVANTTFVVGAAAIGSAVLAATAAIAATAD
jgi:membrane-associated phospholipid phosphatase